MTTISSAIASLLYDHDTVIVPGLGAFVRHDQSAHINVITNEFRRPSSTLSFDPQQREENDLISDYLRACDSRDEEEARTAIAGFVSECFTHLKDEGSVTLPELGTLTMDEQHSLVFEPVDTNFNGDAFGLEDLHPQPIFGGRDVESPRRGNTPPAQGNALGETPRRGNNLPAQGNALGETPRIPKGSSTDREVTGNTSPAQGNVLGGVRSEDPSEKKHSFWWLWLLLLLLVAGGVALWYFNYFKNRPVPTKPWPVPSLQLPERQHFTITEKPAMFTKPEPLQVVVPDATSKVFIVGGCFAMEPNALSMAEEARRQGCAEVFVMKRGSKYFVCYGQYPNTAEAKAAMPYALTNYNPKAWILTK